MRVFVISDFDEYGGVKTHFDSLLKLANNKTGLKFHVYINNPSSYKLKYSNHNKFVFKKIPKNYIFNFYLKNVFLSLFFYDKIIISTGNYFKYIFFGILFPYKTFYIIHSYPIKSNYGFAKKIYYKLIANSKFKFITVSNFSRLKILSFFRPYMINFKVEVVYNQINYPSMNIYNAKSSIVLTIGHLEYWKNPFLWLESAIYICNKYPYISFVWVGDGSLYNELSEKRPLHLHNRIKFKGYQSDVLKYYRNAILYFQPSLMESFGISTLDAMSLGVPCVVSDVGGLPELIISDNFGLKFQSNNFEDAIKKIEFLINNISIRKAISNDAFHFSNENFSAKNWEKNLLKLITC